MTIYIYIYIYLYIYKYIYIYVIMKTICYHSNGFVQTHALMHLGTWCMIILCSSYFCVSWIPYDIYIYNIYIYIYIYIHTHTIVWQLWQTTKFSPCYHKELTRICFGGRIYYFRSFIQEVVSFISCYFQFSVQTQGTSFGVRIIHLVFLKYFPYNIWGVVVVFNTL